MTDNTTLNVGTSGDVIRDIDRGAAKTQVVALDQGGGAGESIISPTNLLNTNDAATARALEGDVALSTVLRGDPSGDFAGQSLIETVMDPGSGEALSARIVNPARQDALGAQMPSDAPYPIVWYAGSVIGSGPIIDTTGYQSIVVSFSTSVASLTPQTANDPAILPQAGTGNAIGWLLGAGAAPVPFGAPGFNASAGQTYIFPVTGKYFRITCNALSGTPGNAIFQLRQVPALQIAQALPVNLSQQGTTLLNGIGGTANNSPLAFGGGDTGGLVRRALFDTNGATVASGAVPAGYPYGNYGQTLNGFSSIVKSQTAVFSTVNPIGVGGADGGGISRMVLTDRDGALASDWSRGTSIGQTIPEMLRELINWSRVQTYYLQQICAAEAGVRDEPEQLFSEYNDQPLAN